MELIIMHSSALVELFSMEKGRIMFSKPLGCKNQHDYCDYAYIRDNSVYMFQSNSLHYVPLEFIQLQYLDSHQSDKTLLYK